MLKKYVAVNDRIDQKPIFVADKKEDAVEMLSGIYGGESGEWLEEHVLELPYLSGFDYSQFPQFVSHESR